MSIITKGSQGGVIHHLIPIENIAGIKIDETNEVLITAANANYRIKLSGAMNKKRFEGFIEDTYNLIDSGQAKRSVFTFREV